AGPEPLQFPQGCQPEEPRDLGEFAGGRRDGPVVAAAGSREGVMHGSAVLQRCHPLDLRPDRGEPRDPVRAGAGLGSPPADGPGPESRGEAGATHQPQPAALTSITGPMRALRGGKVLGSPGNDRQSTSINSSFRSGRNTVSSTPASRLAR